MSKALTAAMLAASVVCADTAYAESFSLPAAITTRGIFTCSGINAACAGEGTNSLVIGTGSDTVRLSFTGVTLDLIITNRAQKITLGTFTVDGREGFTFPERRNPNLPIVNFLFTLEHTEPFNRERERFWRFGPGGRDEIPFMVGQGGSSVTLPPGFGYSRIAYDYDLRPFAIPNNGAIDLNADVGVIPEPATMVLVGGGLAGLVAGRRRRRPAA
jgi:hypothetical protein